LAQADSIFQSSEYARSESIYRECLQQARDSGDQSVEIEALSQIARCRLLDNDKDGARDWLGKAGELASPDDPPGWSRYLGVKGRLEWQSDSIDVAKATFREMFAYCIDKGLSSRAIDAVHMVAIIGTPEEQIEWGQKGIKLAEEVGDTHWLGPLWNNLAITYSDIPDWEKCIDAFKRAREYHWQYGQEIGKLYADYHIGWALRMSGDHEQALTWLRPALAWAERLGNDNVVGQASEDIGEIQIAAGDTAEGIANLKRALTCFEKEGYPDFAPDIFNKVKNRIAELEE
jgi:tetratricopeptide (TPR) repeat protein